MADWPTTPDELIRTQEDMRYRAAPSWRPGDLPLKVGGCFVCFGSGLSPTGARGDAGWAGASLAGLFEGLTEEEIDVFHRGVRRLLQRADGLSHEGQQPTDNTTA